MQIPLKVNKVYLFDIKHGLTMTENFITKLLYYAYTLVDCGATQHNAMSQMVA